MRKYAILQAKLRDAWRHGTLRANARRVPPRIVNDSGHLGAGMVDADARAAPNLSLHLTHRDMACFMPLTLKQGFQQLSFLFHSSFSVSASAERGVSATWS